MYSIVLAAALTGGAEVPDFKHRHGHHRGHHGGHCGPVDFGGYCSPGFHCAPACPPTYCPPQPVCYPHAPYANYSPAPARHHHVASVEPFGGAPAYVAV